jgi:hypothetical protein
MLTDIVNFLRHPFSPDAREELRLPPRKLEWLGVLREAIRSAPQEAWETFGQKWDSNVELGYRTRLGEFIFEVGSVQGWNELREPYAEYFWRIRSVDCADSYLVSVSGSAIARRLFDSLCTATRAFPQPPP